MVFPTFFNLSLNFAVRSSWTEPQSVPVLFLLNVSSFSTFGYKEYNQSGFSIDHLVMSMCINWPQPLRILGSTLNVCLAPMSTARAACLLWLIQRVLWTCSALSFVWFSHFTTFLPVFNATGHVYLLKTKRGLILILFWKAFFFLEFHNLIWNT